ncbi:MAG: YncE family protein [Gemmatimonadales bacterium]
MVLVSGILRPSAKARAPGLQTPCALARSGAAVAIGVAPNTRIVVGARNPGSVAGILRVVADIPLPGRPVRFDYQSLDPISGQLYISHMDDGHVIAFDTRTRRVSGNVADAPRVTGVWVVPRLHKLYASVTGHHQVAVIDLPALTVRATAGPIGFPDGIADVPGIDRIFVSDESVGHELVIDGATDTVIQTIPLGGEAGNTRYDAGSGCVLVAVQTLNQIVAIDPVRAAVVGRFALARSNRPHGMLVDSPNRLLYVANEGNATVEVVDLRTLRITDIQSVGGDPDVLAFDPAWHRLYVATESGGLWVYHVNGQKLALAGVLDLPHAHSVAVDATRHEVYLPLQSLDGHPTLRILAETQSGP